MAPNANVSNVLNRGLLIALSLSLILNCVDQVSAQTFGISDLPTCAQPCATIAGNTVGCQTTDTACLCSNFGVFSNFVEQCANDSCGIEDIVPVGGILGQLCTNQSSSASPSSSSKSASTSSSAFKTSKASVTTPSASTTQTTSSPSVSVSVQTTIVAVASTAASVATNITPANSLTTSGTSTLVVVQTVVLPQSSSPSLTNAARTTAMEAMGATLALATGWVLGVALI